MPDEWEGHTLRKNYAIGKVAIEFKHLSPGPSPAGASRGEPNSGRRRREGIRHHRGSRRGVRIHRPRRLRRGGRRVRGPDDHQHGPAAPVHARGPAACARARGRAGPGGEARHRLPAHRDGEGVRGQHLAPDGHDRDPDGLPVPVLQRARLLARGREAPRDRGAAARAGDPDPHDRAEPHLLAPGLAGNPGDGHGRDLGNALRLPRARAAPRLLRDGHRAANEPQLHRARRLVARPARRLADSGRGLPGDPARADRRVRGAAHRQPDLAAAHRGRRSHQP